jgi:hypothetical protein
VRREALACPASVLTVGLGFAAADGVNVIDPSILSHWITNEAKLVLPETRTKRLDRQFHGEFGS